MKYNQIVKEHLLYEIHESDGDSRVVLESGASLARVMDKLNSDIEFGLITAFRKYDEEGNKVPLKEKQKWNNELIKFFREHLGKTSSYGAYRMVGHWKECSVTLPDGVKISACSEHGGQIEDSLEETWLILNDTKSKYFFEALQATAEKYNQDGFIARVNGEFGLFGKDGDKWADFEKVNEKSLSDSFKRIVNLQGYSELKKKRTKGKLHNIIFDEVVSESIEFSGINVPDCTNSSHMIYTAMNILY